jgi:hypothetical protein
MNIYIFYNIAGTVFSVIPDIPRGSSDIPILAERIVFLKNSFTL